MEAGELALLQAPVGCAATMPTTRCYTLPLGYGLPIAGMLATSHEDFFV
jgi:hypothetical protein